MKTYRRNYQKLGVSLMLFFLVTGFIWIMYKADSPMDQTEDNPDNIGGTFTIYSDLLKEERTFSVSLPNTYNDSEEVYPVIYILDAEMESITTQIMSSINYQNSLGKIPSMILVGVNNVNRNRDTIPVFVEERPGSGGAQKFLRFLDEELIPHIEESYRTSNTRILYGASNAGLFTVYALLENSDSFDAYIASSPMIGWCPIFIHGLAMETFNTSLKGKFLFMIYGSQDYPKVTDYVPDFVELINEETQGSLRWESRLLEGVGHVPHNSCTEGLIAFFEK
jgi:predicted alpha/beta superfamily hydrolase